MNYSIISIIRGKMRGFRTGEVRMKTLHLTTVFFSLTYNRYPDLYFMRLQ